MTVAREFKTELLDREAETVATMARRYLGTTRALEPRIAALAERLAREAAAGTEHTVGSLYRMDRWAELQAQMQKELLRYNGWAASHVEGKRQDMGRLGTLHADSLMEASGVAARFNRLPDRQIAQMVSHVSRGPLNELLTAAYGDTADAVAQRLVDGVAHGLGPREVADTAANALGVDLDRTLTIARTETLRAYRGPQLERFEQFGVVQYRRIATYDDRTCIGCLAEDGNLYDTPDGFDAHPNCRCTAIPETPDVAQPALPSSEEFFASLDPLEQMQMMGAGRYELYSTGQVGWSDLSTRKWDDTWGGAIVPANVSDLRAIAEARGTRAA